MKTKIDVIELAKEIQKETIEIQRQEVEEFINQFNGQTMDVNSIIQDIVAPLIGKVSANQTLFTVELIQRVVDQLESQED
ncbi:hypothetical protein [Bacillus cereus]|uniref:hypothetical protein n=1 Tax=Bacillus cereus TaxID=1396 RepID=UPI00027ABC09|nr:hypothetical protein [Bacillus cereus]EJS72929.1 hypothetical protein ICY_04140 [Bacillus cereus BAG2X1-3]